MSPGAGLFALIFPLIFGCTPRPDSGDTTPPLDTQDTGELEIIKPDGTYNTPDGSATLTVSGGLPTLTLRGDAQSFGYGQGYLLGGEIMGVLNGYLMYTFREESTLDYETAWSYMEHAGWSGDDLVELDAVVEGMKDALPADALLVRPDDLGPREVTVQDVMLFNTLSEWLNLYQCSSFSAWGEHPMPCRIPAGLGNGLVYLGPSSA